MENERLQQRLTELHSLLPLQSKAPSSLVNAIYATSAASRLLPCTRFLDPPSSYYTVSSITANGEDLLRSSGDHGDGMYYGVNSLYASGPDHLDEDTEEGLKKKKVGAFRYSLLSHSQHRRSPENHTQVSNMSASRVAAPIHLSGERYVVLLEY